MSEPQSTRDSLSRRVEHERSLYAETRWLKLRIEDLLGGLAPRVTVKFDERGGPPAITFGLDRRTASEEERRRAFEGVV